MAERKDGLVRLAKLMANRGLASRRKAEEMILAGQVSVNGKVITVLQSVDPVNDVIKVNGIKLPREPEKAYFLLHKPKGCITTRQDPHGRPSVFEYLKGLPIRVEAVGRLDYDTEGALLFTNDGDLAHKLTHPSSEVPKRYMAKVYRTPDKGDLNTIETGVYLDDGKTAPAKVRIVDSTDTGNCWLEITVTEGRNRLIRRMLERLGHPVSKLRRESFATLSIRDMERGEFRLLNAPEIDRIKEIARGIKPSKAGSKRYKKGYARPKPKSRHGRK